jgi:hypothetical protein
VTLRKAIAAAATASLTLASACSTPPRAPDEGLKLRLELAANLLDVADVGMTLFATEVTKSFIAGEPGEVYLAKQMTRNTAVNNLRSLALGQELLREALVRDLEALLLLVLVLLGLRPLESEEVGACAFLHAPEVERLGRELDDDVRV